MSLKVALERLGFGPCYHMTEVFAHPEHTNFWLSAWRGEPVRLGRGPRSYEAAVDWPACTFYEELMERHPEAKVLLSVRDPERWYESTRSTIYELSKITARSPVFRAIFAVFVPTCVRRLTAGKPGVRDHLGWNLRRPLRGQGLRHRGLRAAHRGGETPRPTRTVAGLRGGAGLGPAVRVPRRARTGRAFPPPQRRGGDAAQGSDQSAPSPVPYALLALLAVAACCSSGAPGP